MQRDVETVVAQDDQEFLAKLQIILNKASTPSVKPVSLDDLDCSYLIFVISLLIYNKKKGGYEYNSTNKYDKYNTANH